MSLCWRDVLSTLIEIPNKQGDLMLVVLVALVVVMARVVPGGG